MDNYEQPASIHGNSGIEDNLDSTLGDDVEDERNFQDHGNNNNNNNIQERGIPEGVGGGESKYMIKKGKNIFKFIQILFPILKKLQIEAQSTGAQEL